MWIRNAWYIAAWSDAIGQAPFARRILDERIVLFRDSSGAAAALEDRCCHRGTPLALGEVVADGLQCGYHGLVFDRSGKCVLVPGGHTIPPDARVRSYPVAEKNALVWIWMGDPARADRSLILDYPYHDDAKNWPHRHTTYPIKCNYLLLIDNLMDLSHLGFIHKETIGGMSAAPHVEARMRTVRTPAGVRFERWMIDSEPPPTYVKAAGFKGRIDRWQEFEFVAPSTVLQWSGAVDAGRGEFRDFKYYASREGGFSLRLLHGITPETENTCFYFWSTANGYRQDDPAATAALFDEIARAFGQDKTVLEAQQARLDESPNAPLVDIHGDGARIHARRAVERMLAEENTAAARAASR
jgi:phenylpropionate dioxygenase-like ring-hydroxylating dioxygenase large terminal subunit